MRKVVIRDVEALEDAIIKSGRTARSFAAEIGLSSAAFPYMLSGKRGVSPKTAKKIADGLSLGFDDLFDVVSVEHHGRKNTESA